MRYLASAILALVLAFSLAGFAGCKQKAPSAPSSEENAPAAPAAPSNAPMGNMPGATNAPSQ